MPVPDWLIPLLGGNTIVSAALGYFVPAMVTRKKDAGEMSNDFARNLMARLEEVERGHAKCEARTAELGAICTRNDLVIRLVVPELERVSPYSTALHQARDLLGTSFPVLAPLPTPPDMTATLDKIP